MLKPNDISIIGICQYTKGCIFGWKIELKFLILKYYFWDLVVRNSF
jgi:hypothetical protein